MSLSSNVIINNLEPAMILCMLLFKLLLLSIVGKLMPEKVKKIISIETKWRYIIILEFISLIPILVLSAGTAILNLSCNNYQDKINVICQALILFSPLIATSLILIKRRSKKRYAKKKIIRNY